MDISVLPGLSKKSWELPWGGKKKKKKAPKKKAAPRGGVGGVLDAVAEKNRRLKEAAGD